jgi:acetyl-CoA acetyltransferase
VAVVQRENANRRPEAQMYGRNLTLADYLNSPMLVEPLRVPDCCLVSDGGAAVVVTTAERARDLKRNPVYIMGAGLGHMVSQGYRKQNYVSYATGIARDTAFREAGVTIDDIDFAELYEPFSIGVIVQLEELGFCKKGEGGPFVEAGNTRLTGSLPVNTGGGQSSWCYLQGYTPLAEAVLQLTGRGGETQLPNHRICVVTGHGGTSDRSMYYSDACLVLRRD